LSAAGLAGFHGLELGEELADVAGVQGFGFSLGLIGGGEGIALGLKDAGSDGLGQELATLDDLRRTCARLCRKNGGDLEQIKFLLGHSSIQTTERYLGSEQEIAIAVNDHLGL
jgi:hypothetical protein